jgi:PIN domain nuclease of toxin-antitoxin system
MTGLLLDTCVIIFASEDKPLREEARDRLAGRDEENLFLSPVSAWELGKLTSSGKLRLPIDPLDYFNEIANRSGLSVCDLTPEILVRSSMLPELKHKDPMDRLLIATARINNYTLVTRDRAILAYGSEGHVKTLAC